MIQPIRNNCLRVRARIVMCSMFDCNRHLYRRLDGCDVAIQNETSDSRQMCTLKIVIVVCNPLKYSNNIV